MVKRILAAALLLCLMAGFTVPAFAAEAENTDVPTMEFRFGDYGSNGDYLADVTQNLMNSYLAKSVNWRFEASSDIYQFRIAGKHPEITTTGKNLFSPGALQFCGAKGWWYALRLRASETGKFALTMTTAREATIQVYFFPASRVENALGDNAVAYAQTICQEPYFAAETEAFAAYKEVIGGLLADAQPVMTASAETPSILTGEYSFHSENEYIMVIEFLNEETYRTQLSPLVATWIAEAEALPQDDMGADMDIQKILIPAMIVAVVVIAGVVIGVVAFRKKGKNNA